MKTCHAIMATLLLVFSAGSSADIWSESYEQEAAGHYDRAAELFDPLLKQ